MRATVMCGRKRLPALAAASACDRIGLPGRRSPRALAPRPGGDPPAGARRRRAARRPGPAGRRRGSHSGAPSSSRPSGGAVAHAPARAWPIASISPTGRLPRKQSVRCSVSAPSSRRCPRPGDRRRPAQSATRLGPSLLRRPRGRRPRGPRAARRLAAQRRAQPTSCVRTSTGQVEGDEQTRGGATGHGPMIATARRADGRLAGRRSARRSVGRTGGSTRDSISRQVTSPAGTRAPAIARSRSTPDPTWSRARRQGA